MNNGHRKSEEFVKLLAMLVQLDVVPLDMFLAAAIDVSSMFDIKDGDYVRLVLSHIPPEV